MFLIIVILAVWALFFHYYPVEEIISRIGVQNTYLAAFLLSVIGGFSSLTGTSLYAALIVLSKGGMNPFVLGIIAGLGLFLSDSIFYFIATHMRTLVSGITTRWERLFRNIWKWVHSTPDWIVYTAVFIYAAFAPLPNDVILVALALSNYSYRKFAVFLFLGDLTISILLTVFGGSLSSV